MVAIIYTCTNCVTCYTNLQTPLTTISVQQIQHYLRNIKLNLKIFTGLLSFTKPPGKKNEVQLNYVSSMAAQPEQRISEKMMQCKAKGQKEKPLNTPVRT